MCRREQPLRLLQARLAAVLNHQMGQQEPFLMAQEEEMDHRAMQEDLQADLQAVQGDLQAEDCLQTTMAHLAYHHLHKHMPHDVHNDKT